MSINILDEGIKCAFHKKKKNYTHAHNLLRHERESSGSLRKMATIHYFVICICV